MIRRRGGIQLVHNSFCQGVKHPRSTNGCVGIGKGTTRRALLRILAHLCERMRSASNQLPTNSPLHVRAFFTRLCRSQIMHDCPTGPVRSHRLQRLRFS
jgi:hypothetical protein